VLERLWNGQAGRPAVQVLNLGVPGMNSSKLRNNLRALLASLHPDTVLVLIGANDPWTVPAAPDEEAEPTFAERLWQRSRVFRLLYMIDRGIRGVEPAPAPEVALEPVRDEREGRLQGARAAVHIGGRELDLTWTGKAAHRTSGWTRSLAVTLAALRSAAAESGSEIVLLTYASELRAYGAANEVIRAARADDLPVIDLGRAFTALCTDGPCEELFFPDGHPTRLGYQIVAGVVWRELERLRGEPGTPHDQANWQAVLDDEARSRLAMTARLH
jgi:lysophospholipase L1-like esterase